MTENGERLSIRFPASQDPGIRSAQELLVQAWGKARAQHVGGTRTGWCGEGGKAVGQHCGGVLPRDPQDADGVAPPMTTHAA